MKKVIVATLLFLCFSCNLSADEVVQPYEPLLDNINEQQFLDKLPEHTRKELSKLGLDEVNPQNILDHDLSKTVGYLTEQVKNQMKEPMTSFARIVGVIVLLAVLEALRTTSEDSKNLTQVFAVVSTLVVCTYIARPLISCITDTSDIIADCSQFILSFLPVFTGLLAACGQAGTASVTHVFLFWLCQIASQFASNVLIGMVGLYSAISVVAAATPTLRLENISGSIKTVISWVLGLTMTIFVGTLTLSSVVAASGDNLGTRTARFFLGSFVPVVGGALSEAFSTAQSCLRMVRSSVGVYAIVAVVVLFLPVILRLVCWYITAGVSSTISNLLGLNGIGSLTRSMGTALGFLLALLLCFLLILLVAFTLVLMLGQGMG